MSRLYGGRIVILLAQVSYAVYVDMFVMHLLQCSKHVIFVNQRRSIDGVPSSASSNEWNGLVEDKTASGTLFATLEIWQAYKL